MELAIILKKNVNTVLFILNDLCTHLMWFNMGEVFFKKGAEAELEQSIVDEQNVLIKKRIKKRYRDNNLDEELRKKRTRAEVKLLQEASKVINVPKIINVDEKNSVIVMEFISGKPLKEVVLRKEKLCIEAGKRIRALHDMGIIHGDLTTSNILFVDKKQVWDEILKRIEKKGELFFIDFGLGFFSTKIEDKATDLVVFKKTFNATHSSLKKGWSKVIKGYNPSKEMITCMEKIEKRARYH